MGQSNHGHVLIISFLLTRRFAALALATDPPSPDVLDRHPDRPNAGLVSKGMKIMIGAQAICQIVIMLVLQFLGPKYIPQRAQLRTFIFNTFIFLQLFNEVNCRVLDGSLNFLKGLTSNYYFPAIWILTLVAQFMIVQFGGEAFSTVQISPMSWLVSVSIGFTSILVGLLVRAVIFPLVLKEDPPRHVNSIDIEDGRQLWISAYRNVQRSRAFYSAIRRARDDKIRRVPGRNH